MSALVYRFGTKGLLLVGALKTSETAYHQFRYDNAYLASGTATPLSLALPLRAESFPNHACAAYFEAFIPEEGSREEIARALNVRGNNYLEILEAIGYECVGDIIVVSSEAVSEFPASEYRELSALQFEALATATPREIVEMQIASRLSLAGAQLKVGLYHDADQPIEKGWFLPSGLAPSSHILKVPHPKVEHLLLNECLVMNTARACGVNTAQVQLIGTELPLLAIERFDRSIHAGVPKASGLPMPRRHHQQDIAQALGVLGQGKYEHPERPKNYAAQIAALLRRHSSNRVADITQFVAQVLFSYAVGNCDNHLKNYSLLSASDATVRLAPAYDIISTTVPGYIRNMGLFIGGAVSIDSVTIAAFVQFASEIQVPYEQIALQALKMAAAFEPALSGEAQVLAAQGHTYAPELAREILADAAPRLEVLAAL